MTLRACAMLLAAALAGAPPAAAQGAPPAVVVLTFENGGSYGMDSLDFSGLARAIPATLTADLALNPGLRAVPYAQGRAALPQGGRVDATTAARVGKQLGASEVVTGTFVDYYGRVRIDARLIDAANGAILEVVSTGQRARAELPQMVADISAQLMSGKRLPALPSGTAGTAPLSTEALVLFGRGVLAQEQGDAAAAADYYQRALKVAPNFTAAKEGLASVRS